MTVLSSAIPLTNNVMPEVFYRASSVLILTKVLTRSSIGALEDDSIEFSDTYNEQRRAPRVLLGT
ncbi:hypothetical protein BCT05_16715 [Vibrio breoganii]|uniref:hypothetical protein n=1 Tax=Vibrio breoganii TaxID=553239 RepID=UPI000C82E40C|nr:hypothetical protein [Vibrio breoganii]PML97701.1 hypothetical protein BCT64_06175 [Vibrio breoganii]PMO31088.1 hypothetical protein BCT13_12225 [Vibrio breoganii]PMO61379.1 hypothetical protein BCT05_16715 [Vibrio breoganii]